MVRQADDWDGFVDILVEVGKVGDQAGLVGHGQQLGQAGGNDYRGSGGKG